MLAALDRDSIFQAVVGAGGPWIDVEVYPTCGSTNAELLRDPRPWRLVLADEQVAGRGRLERSWSTPPGVALAISASLPVPQDWTSLAWFSPMTAMAVTAALVQVTGVRAGWKWPNDVLAARSDGLPATADGSAWGKVCGILGQVSGASTLVIGAGVNFLQTFEQLPVPAATSVAACGGQVGPQTRQRWVEAFAGELARLHAEVVAGGSRAAAVADAYREGCLTMGLEVRADLPDGTSFVGRAIDVDSGGSLVVEADDRRRALAAGDVAHLHPAEGGYA